MKKDKNLEEIKHYGPSKKRLYLGGNILLRTGLLMESAPEEVQFIEPHYEIIIPIGPDHHATLYISESAALAFKKEEAKPIVF